MQAANQQNLFKPEVIIEILLRRRWWIIVPVILSLVVGIILTIKLPKEYVASTTILVEPQSVPQNFVRSIVTEGIESRIQTISQQILSRTNLERIVTEFNLLRNGQSEPAGMEAAVNGLASRIGVHVGKERGKAANYFKISFRSENPQLARDIPNRLANSFIDENLKNREDKSVSTSTFLLAELEQMRERLEEKEEKLREYRFTHMGSLPDQLTTNLRTLDRLQAQLADKENSIRELRDRLQLAMATGEDASGAEMSLPKMEEQLANLQLKYTDKHPDVIRLRTQIEAMKNQLNDPNSAIRQLPAARSTGRYLNPIVQRLQQEIRFAEVELDQIRNQIRDYEMRVEETPKHEQELQAVIRDYNNIQATYNSLLNRKLEAEIAVNMERKQKGEQFRVIDPARTPIRPDSPDMQKLFLMVLAAGIGIGGGLILLFELLNPTFRIPEDIENYLNFSVMAIIPIIKDQREILLTRLNRAGTISALVVLTALIAAFYSLSIGGGDPASLMSRFP
ncbi:MAG: XrtA system polysaccharide chain length determinant [Desulfobacterales bacterium]